MPVDLTTDEGRSAFVMETLQNPETRKAALQLLKKVAPDTVVPELDTAEEVKGEILKELSSKEEVINNLKSELSKVKSEQERANKWYQLRQKGFSDQEILEAEKIIADGKIADVETALEYKRLKHRPPDTAEAGDGVLAPLNEQPAFDLAELKKLTRTRDRRTFAKAKALEEYQKIRSQILGR